MNSPNKEKKNSKEHNKDEKTVLENTKRIIRHQSIDVQTNSHLAAALSMLPALEAEERKELISMIDKKDEREFIYHVEKQKHKQALKMLWLILSFLMIGGIVGATFFLKDYTLIELIIPLASGALAGGGGTAVYYQTKVIPNLNRK